MGCVVTRFDEEPKKDLICCPRIDLVSQSNVCADLISRSSSSKGSSCWSIWKVGSQASTFLASPDLKRPSSKLAYNIPGYVKPKACENVHAELKLGFRSVSILDSSYGMGITPLETEVTNLGSRAGKGDIIGAVPIPVGRNMGALKRVSSIKIFHHAPDFHQAISVDNRESIYLTMFAQGGWPLKKDVSMIWGPAGMNNASSFLMVQKPSKRMLRASIERDTCCSDAAYWIENDCALPLSYRMVLVEPLKKSDKDSLLLGQAVKSAKLALRYSSKALGKRASCSRRNVEILESIVDSSNPRCVMLSPVDYLNRSNPFQSRNGNVTPTRVSVSVAIGNSNNFIPGASLLELETEERIDIRAFGSGVSYYGLAAQLKMASDRTKVLHFLPSTLFLNRICKSIILSQFETSSELVLRPSDPPKQFTWQSHIRTELLRVRVDGNRWIIPFSFESDGVMCISLNRVQVRSFTKSSCCEVLFLPASSVSSPYWIEKRSMYLPIRFRQVDGYDNSWHGLRPNPACSFFWEDLSRNRMLELTIGGSDPSTSRKYTINESADHIPFLSSPNLPKKPLRVPIFKEGKKQVTRVLDLLSKTTEGANAVKNKFSSVITAEEQLQRRRLPRIIGGDNLLRPFDEYKAAVQAILQLAGFGKFLGQVDLLKVIYMFVHADFAGIYILNQLNVDYTKVPLQEKIYVENLVRTIHL